MMDYLLLDHLRTMALHGVDLSEVEAEVTTQMAWSKEVDLIFSEQRGHEFVPAPKSMRFSQVRADGQRVLLLMLEHDLPAGAPDIDHLKKLNWVYAGPSGVFSPKQTAAFWAALCTGYEAVTNERVSYSERHLERHPPDDLLKRSSKMTINLGQLIAYQSISKEIFDRLLDDHPCDDLMFQRTRLQALYRRYPCDKEEFDRVRATREIDPVARAIYGLDAYYEHYAQSRAKLDPEKGMLELRQQFKDAVAPIVSAGAQAGLYRETIAVRLSKNLNLHMLHQHAMEAFVDEVLGERSTPSPRVDRQAA